MARNNVGNRASQLGLKWKIMFNTIYEMMLRWAAHRFAERYLAVIAFAESSFFPIPVEVMLAPTAFAKPNRYLRIAIIASVFSVLGGIFGYAIGYFGIEIVEPWIHKFGYTEKYATINRLFSEWGFWIVFVAGFSPLPYKLFTISAGGFGVALVPFIIASIVGRSSRFLLVSWLFAKLGPKMAPVITRYIEWLGWISVAGLAGALWFYSIR